MAVSIITPAAPHMLTTVARARTMLGLSASADAALKMAIQAATAAAETYCLRSFAIETVRQGLRRSVWREDDIHPHFLLERYPVVAVNSVTYCDRVQNPDIYELIEDRLYVGAFSPILSGRSHVEYTTGYTMPSDVDGAVWTLPADVERAAILLVGSSMSMTSRDPMVKVSEVEGIGRREYYVQGARAALPHPEAEAILAGYRAVVLS